MRARFAAVAGGRLGRRCWPSARAGGASASAAAPARQPHQAVTPIKHFVFLMQGGRTFDNYFGTYPGADGLPAGTCQLAGHRQPPTAASSRSC